MDGILRWYFLESDGSGFNFCLFHLAKLHDFGQVTYSQKFYL